MLLRNPISFVSPSGYKYETKTFRIPFVDVTKVRAYLIMEALQARAEILSLIKAVSEEQGIDNYTITDVKTNQKGEGYLGEIFMVNIKSKNNGKLLQVVIKAAFINEKVREKVPIRLSFLNEINFYNNVKPAYDKLEQEHGIVTAEFVPKCFKVSVEEQAEVLVLENLKAIGFEIFDKKLILDDDHVKLIFKNYGKVHGYSFVLRDQKPEEYARITKEFHNIYDQMLNNEFFFNYLLDISKMVSSTLVPGEDDEVIQKYEKYTNKELANVFSDSISENVDHSAILHGDCWSNNMLFKYQETSNGRKPIDIRLIDWQLVKLGSPVCDLSYCLYSGASKEVFDNLNEYLQIYYESFSSFVTQLGSDPAKLFPFSVLKKHWSKYAKFGLIMASPVLKMKLTNPEDIVDFQDDLKMEEYAGVVAKQRFDKDGFHRRMKELVRHMSEVDAL